MSKLVKMVLNGQEGDIPEHGIEAAIAAGWQLIEQPKEVVETKKTKAQKG